MSQRSRRSSMLFVPVIASLALAAGALSAVAVEEPSTPAATQEFDAPVREPLDTGSAPQPARGLIVKLDETDDATVSGLVDEVTDELPGDVTVAESETGTDDLGLLSLSEQVDASDLDAAIDVLEQQPGVEWAVPNGVRMPSATANDPAFVQGALWNLNGAWGVRADKAWDVTTGSSGVRVAVIDTGIRPSHPDLRGRYVAGRDFVDDEYRCANRACTKIVYRRTFVSANDGNSWDASAADPGDWRGARTCPEMDAGSSSWHGTHVAGTVAATRNNNQGVVGIAPGVKVQPIRALGRCGGTDWDIAMSILWASGVNVTKYDRSHGRIPVNRTPAKVINLSLGAPASSLRLARQTCRLYGSIAGTARARGSILIAAAGNEGINQQYNIPSSCSGFVSVAATTPSGARAFYSNYGTGIDIGAPGGTGTAPGSDNILSTYNEGSTTPTGDSYTYMAGTSMASPAVAAVAALGHSVGITHPVVLERVIKATARKSGCTPSQCGAGIADAYGVVTAKAPLSAPRISGAARPGGTLTATPGRWRNTAAVNLTWYRGSRVVATGSTYRPTRSDLGATITVRSRAEGGLSSIFHQASVVVKQPSRTAFSMPKKFAKSKRVKLTVKVASSGLRPTGTIRVYDGKRRIATKKMYAKNGGRVTIKLPKLKKKGKHTIRVVYSGNAKIKGSSRAKVVRVR